MRQSETIEKLAEALSKAQGAFVNPSRNRTVTVKMKMGGTYNFAYATLDGIMEMIRKPLADNGLALVHSLGKDDQGPIAWTLDNGCAVANVIDDPHAATSRCWATGHWEASKKDHKP